MNNNNSMEIIKKIIQDHPFPVIGLALFGIIGTGVTIYAWLFPPSQRPVYNISHVHIITPTLTEKASGLNITYNGETIDNLTISKIGLINWGKEVIKREDIPDKGRFYLQFKDDIRIYDQRIIFTTENANNSSMFQVIDLPEVEHNKENVQNKIEILQKYNNRVYWDFDYLAHSEGVIIQVAHSGSSNNTSFSLQGTLPGNPLNYRVIESIIDRVFPYSSLFWLLYLGFYSYIILDTLKQGWKSTKLLFCMIFIVISGYYFIAKSKPYMTQLTSIKLLKYHEQFYSDWNLNSKKGNLTSKQEIEEIDGIKFIIERQKYSK